MQEQLKEKLWAYVVQNNPDLMLNLQADFSVTLYLEEKVAAIVPMIEKLTSEKRPPYVIEELCMNELTSELRPSRFIYLRTILQEEFESDHGRLRDTGVLTYEVVNLIGLCSETFDSFGFNEENQEDRHLRYAIIAQVHDYLL